MSNDNEQKYCFNFEQCDLHVVFTFVTAAHSHAHRFMIHSRGLRQVQTWGTGRRGQVQTSRIRRREVPADGGKCRPLVYADVSYRRTGASATVHVERSRGGRARGGRARGSLANGGIASAGIESGGIASDKATDDGATDQRWSEQRWSER